MSWDVFGGCDTATITAYGGATILTGLYNWLRYGVTIVDKNGRKVWWGYVNAVYVMDGPIEIGLSLDEMANSVQVAYSYVQPGTNEVGTRKITTAVTNTDSITEFGTKEIVVSQGGLTDTAASDMATRYLADHKFPTGTASVMGTGQPYGYFPAQRGTFARVRLECKGWINTLAWRYANVTKAGVEANTGTPPGYALGDAAANTQVGQTFTVGTTNIYFTGISLYIRQQGSPTDNVTVEIYAVDGSGNPTGSALLTGATFLYTEMGTGSGTAKWIRHDFTTPYTLTAGTQYIIVCARTGAVDGTNYFLMGGNSAGSYAGGIRKTYNPTTWTDTATDIMFRVNINQLLETSQQIKDLETTYGNFITYTDIITASGVSIGANRDGDVTVYDVIKELCSYGGPNDRRMKVTVTSERVLMVEEEEASTVYKYYIDTSGRIISTGEVVLPPYMPPVGRWIYIKDFIPGAGNPIYLANAMVQYLEGADWSLSGGLTPRFRGQADINDLVRLAGAGGYE
jgi:hypothetical protein